MIRLGSAARAPLFLLGVVWAAGAALPIAVGSAVAGCGSGEPMATEPTATDPVQLGVIREVPIERLMDEREWGPELDLDLEAEFWDLISNSEHARYRSWHEKTTEYLEGNTDAAPRLRLLLSAGAVFSLAPVFQAENPVAALAEMDAIGFVADATTGAGVAFADLMSHEPANVFFHNNQAMLAFLLTADSNETQGREVGLCHLERMRELENENASFVGTEGRAAAPFTYGMVHEEAYVDYAIALSEDCTTWICSWTSKLAPFKPIGQLLMLAELHAFKAALTNDASAREAATAKVTEILDRTEAIARDRDWPFIDRIDTIRAELATRTYAPGLGLGRFPTPIYANGDNCSGCHIGGQAGAFGQVVDRPYEGHDVVTAIPAAPNFLPGDVSGHCNE